MESVKRNRFLLYLISALMAVVVLPAAGSADAGEEQRDVLITDPAEAVEMIVIASNILKIVEDAPNNNIEQK